MMPAILADASLKETPALVKHHEKIRQCALLGCENTFRGFGHSFITTYATRGGDARLGAFQCPPAHEIQAGNLECQHFACCEEHALIVHFLCMRDHIMPQHLQEVQQLAKIDQQPLEARPKQATIKAAKRQGRAKNGNRYADPIQRDHAGKRNRG